MKYTETIGIDVSKDVIDVSIHTLEIHKQFKNNKKGFKELVKWCLKHSNKIMDEILIAFEHTGLYSMSLAAYLDSNKYNFCMLSALEIKRSLGLVRGKNDKVDSARIANYAYMRRDNLDAYTMPAKEIFKLQKIISLRRQLVRERAKQKGTLREYKQFLKKKDYKLVFVTQEKLIVQLTKHIKNLENEILTIIKDNDTLQNIYSLITSVKGIGLVLAANLIVTTNCFTAFENSRKYACYAGIAPFEKQSGSSLKTRARVSQLANKKMKSLLNMAASTAILYDPELKQYYARRIAEGKSRMSTLNIVRNKIVHRVFAVVKRGTPYVCLNRHAG